MSGENEPGGRTGAHDEETVVHRARYERASERSLSTEVVRAVAVAAGTSPADLDDRIADSIDADALDGLFDPSSSATGPASSGVWFEFSSYRVVVYGSGEIEVRSPTASGAPDWSRGGPPPGRRGGRPDGRRPVDPC